MSLFSDEDVLTKEIKTWRGFIEKFHIYIYIEML
jgi:hypothetical protein